MRRNFEELGLNLNEARVLVALFESGRASPPELARRADIHRTTVYPVLQELSRRGLARQVAGEQPTWTAVGREEALDRLRAAQEERLRGLRARVEETRAMLEDLEPVPAAALPVQFVHSAARTRALYEELVGEATSELVVCNRPPYSWSKGESNAAVLDAMGRGLAARALYQAEEIYAPEAEAFRRAHEEYMTAGVELRVVEHLPLKLAVFDRAVALLAIPDPAGGDDGYPTVLLVEDPGFASMLAASFDHLWQGAKPYSPLAAGARAPVEAAFVTRSPRESAGA